MTGAVALLASTGYRLAAGQPVAFVLGYELVSHATLIAAVIALGYSVRTRREIAERGRVLAHLTRERGSDRGARPRRTVETRSRSARLLGHALSVAVLFTGVAKEKYGDALGAGEADAPRGDGTDEPLDRVRAALIEALADLRSTVTLLRSSNTERPADLTLDDIPCHASRSRACRRGDRAAHGHRSAGTGQEIQHTVFRLVQEAVTNSLKHSDASHPSGHRLLTATGTSRSPSPTTAARRIDRRQFPQFGNGLTGMQERIRALARESWKCTQATAGGSVPASRLEVRDDPRTARRRPGIGESRSPSPHRRVRHASGGRRGRQRQAGSVVANCGPMCT